MDKTMTSTAQKLSMGLRSCGAAALPGAYREQDAADGELQDRQVGVAVRQKVREPRACSMLTSMKIDDSGAHDKNPHPRPTRLHACATSSCTSCCTYAQQQVTALPPKPAGAGLRKRRTVGGAAELLVDFGGPGVVRLAARQRGVLRQALVHHHGLRCMRRTIRAGAGLSSRAPVATLSSAPPTVSSRWPLSVCSFNAEVP
jgi:hypothetical protein